MNYIITFYVPTDACDIVKKAMFAAGAGSQGNYDNCCWQVLGQGQFRALQGSQPAIGQQDELTQIDEFRVEMLCNEHHIIQAIQAMKKAHPYEEIAFNVTENIDF